MPFAIRHAAPLIAALLLCGAAVAQSQEPLAERELVAAVNHERRIHGLAPLRWDESLATVARHHAAVMARHGSAEHLFGDEPNLSARVKQAGIHFTWLSENVAQGPTADFIQSQFMRSSSHRANILDSDMNSIGVGVIERNHQLFAVEDFAQIHGR
jgi:uncharacterized protein YkwD